MSTTLRNPKATPNRVSRVNNPTEIFIHWRAGMTDPTDNPIRITLTIPPEHPLFFLNVNDQRVKQVIWDKDYLPGTNEYDDNVFVVVGSAPAQHTNVKIMMSTMDSNGFPNTQAFTLQYV